MGLVSSGGAFASDIGAAKTGVNVDFYRLAVRAGDVVRQSSTWRPLSFAYSFNSHFVMPVSLSLPLARSLSIRFLIATNCTAVCDGCSPGLRFAQVLSRLWAAHREAIRCVHIVAQHPPSLVTAAFDCKVRVWSAEGECTGALLDVRR